MRVLIPGGGIGGLTAALSLLRHGIDVEVYEQAAELKEVGAGVQRAANGTRVLHALGVGEELKALSCEAQGKEIRHWQTGETWKLFDLGPVSIERYGAPYFTVYRPDLLDVLASAVRRAKPDAIRLGARCRGFTQDDESVTLQLENGAMVRGDALIGADGVHSGIRQALFGADRPEFTGVIAWRGIVPMERLPAHMARRGGSKWVGPGGHHLPHPLRARRPHRALPAARRAADELRRRARALGLAHRVLERARHAGGADRRLSRLASRHPGLHPRHRGAVQVGAHGARAARALDRWPRHASGRCGTFHAPVPRARRGHGDRRRLCSGALPGTVRRRDGAAALRISAARAHAAHR